MGKITTIKVPACDRHGIRIEDQEVSGQVCILTVDGHKIRCLIHDDIQGRTGKVLTHIASGRRLGNLNAIKVAHHRSYYRLTDRGAAELLLRNLTVKHGLAKVRDTLLDPPEPPAIGEPMLVRR